MKGVHSFEAPSRRTSLYPGDLKNICVGREKRALGNLFNLTQFGVNQTILEPGAGSSHRHWHHNEDEFIYVLRGHITLITDAGEEILEPGMCAGFKANDPNGHHLFNKTNEIAEYLEIGTRALNGECEYPDVDLHAVTENGSLRFLHKDGTPYEG